MEYFVHSIYDFCGLFFLILLLYRKIRVMICYFVKGNQINGKPYEEIGIYRARTKPIFFPEHLAQIAAFQPKVLAVLCFLRLFVGKDVMWNYNIQRG